QPRPAPRFLRSVRPVSKRALARATALVCVPVSVGRALTIRAAAMDSSKAARVVSLVWTARHQAASVPSVGQPQVARAAVVLVLANDKGECASTQAIDSATLVPAGLPRHR